MEFNLEFKNEKNYCEVARVEVKFKKMPNQNDRDDLLNAIEVVRDISEKYIDENTTAESK